LKLDNFINGHIDEILAEWEAFARTLLSAADEVSKLVLRNQAGDILKAIALDITISQDPQQQDKSRGMSPDIGAKSAASIHGVLRQAGNFTPLQLGAEFRALRGRGQPGDTRPRTSLGLRLFVAREIAITHGGNLSVTSSGRDGTTFTALLPRMAASPRSGLHLVTTHDGVPVTAINGLPLSAAATVLKN
jgi:hypothetical protein